MCKLCAQELSQWTRKGVICMTAFITVNFSCIIGQEKVRYISISL